jgi:hypothetical protein
MKRLLNPSLRVVAAIVSLEILAGAPQAQESGPLLSDLDAVSVARAVNTAETEAFFKRDSYPTVEQLSMSARFRGGLERAVPGATLVLGDSVSGAVRDYKLSILTSGDAKHYSLILVPKSPTKCGVAVFSSDAGVIYTGKALACPVK